MNDTVRYFIQCRVFDGDEDVRGTLREFEVEAEAHLPLKQLIREFLVAYHESALAVPESERPDLSIWIDDDVPIDQCVTVRLIDDHGEPEVLDLDIVPAQEGYPAGTKFEVVPGQFIVGVRILGFGRGPKPKRQGASETPPERRDTHPPTRETRPRADGQTRRIRIRNELEALEDLRQANPSILEFLAPQRREEVWTLSQPLVVRLYVPGWVRHPSGEILKRPFHDVKITFPPGYPMAEAFRFASLPEQPPILHPNVNPDPDPDGSGHYICLFTDDVPTHRKTLIEAFLKLEALISWKAANLEGGHVMDEDASDLFEQTRKGLQATKGTRFRIPPRLRQELIQSQTSNQLRILSARSHHG